MIISKRSGYGRNFRHLAECCHAAVNQRLEKLFREQERKLASCLGLWISCSLLRRGVSKRHFYLCATLLRPSRGFLCFSSNSLDQLCKWLRNTLTAGSQIVVSACAKGTRQPSLQDSATSLPWLPSPASCFQPPVPPGKGMPVSAGKNCLSGTILTGSSCKLGKLHSDLQICSTSTCLMWNQISTGGLDWPTFFSACGPAQRNNHSPSLLCALEPHGHLWYPSTCMVMHLIPWHNTFQLIIKLLAHSLCGKIAVIQWEGSLCLTSGFFTWGKEQGKKS